jgi:CBS domain-containing protein
MRTVMQILQSKGDQVWTIEAGASVFDALKLMAEKEIGALVVIEKNRVVGIFSERDYASKVILLGRSSKETQVREIMTAPIIWVTPDTTVQDCMALMSNRRIRHLPVMERERMVGVISIGDVVKAIISEQEYMIEHLGDYIVGR